MCSIAKCQQEGVSRCSECAALRSVNRKVCQGAVSVQHCEVSTEITDCAFSGWCLGLSEIDSSWQNVRKLRKEERKKGRNKERERKEEIKRERKEEIKKERKEGRNKERKEEIKKEKGRNVEREKGRKKERKEDRKKEREKGRNEER